MIRLPWLRLKYHRPVPRYPVYLLVAMLVFAYGAIAVASQRLPGIGTAQARPPTIR